uniref:Uncharacterized protein n=1 Tax=Biomphalaria glabrata TaxID=6526 RepID=A0A2C9L9R3_BIOGL
MPAKVAADLLKQLFSVMKQTCSDEMALQQAAGEGDGEGLDNSAKSSLVSCVMARVLFAAGEVAFRQMVFMEVDVLTEMKRRQALNEENKKGRRKSKGTDISKVGMSVTAFKGLNSGRIHRNTQDKYWESHHYSGAICLLGSNYCQQSKFRHFGKASAAMAKLSNWENAILTMATKMLEYTFR